MPIFSEGGRLKKDERQSGASASLDANISTCNRCYVSGPFGMRERKVLVEELLLTQLDGAYNLARWIVESDADARDVVQEGYTYALKQLEKFRAADIRIRLLTIVRQRAYAWIRRRSDLSPVEEATWLDPADKTSRALAPDGQKRDLHAALPRLPVEFREILMLYEIEGCSYAQLAEILELSTAAVTCRLSQARKLLRWEMTEIQRRRSPERVGPKQRHYPSH
jgi:RNA polymerase sigma factor (sigma-70 family)